MSTLTAVIIVLLVAFGSWCIGYTMSVHWHNHITAWYVKYKANKRERLT